MQCLKDLCEIVPKVTERGEPIGRETEFHSPSFFLLMAADCFGTWNPYSNYLLAYDSLYLETGGFLEAFQLLLLQVRMHARLTVSQIK